MCDIVRTIHATSLQNNFTNTRILIEKLIRNYKMSSLNSTPCGPFGGDKPGGAIWPEGPGDPCVLILLPPVPSDPQAFKEVIADEEILELEELLPLKTKKRR